MRISKLILIVMLSLLLSSCSNNPIAKEELVVYEYDHIHNYKYHQSIIVSDDFGLSSPKGIVSDSEGIYICDSGNDRIVKIDFEGNALFEFGSLGSLDGELQTPVSIALDNDYLYVNDSGNKRIQIFTKKGDFVEQIKIKQFNDCYLILDVEVDDEGAVYATTIATGDDLKSSGIFSVDKKGEIRVLDNYISGMLGKGRNGDIYYSSKYWLQDEYSWASGHTELYKINNSEIIAKKGLSETFFTADISCDGEFLYIYNGGYGYLEKFTDEGEYIETIYSAKTQKQEIETSENDIFCEGITVDNNGNFYLSDSANNLIYKLEYNSESSENQ